MRTSSCLFGVDMVAKVTMSQGRFMRKQREIEARALESPYYCPYAPATAESESEGVYSHEMAIIGGRREPCRTSEATGHEF